MKKGSLTLLCMLLVSALLLTAVGAAIKYMVLEPLGIQREESLIALPFVMLADDALSYAVDSRYYNLMNPTEPPTEPPTQPPTEPPTEPVTEPPTEPPTEPGPVDESWFDDVLFIGDSRTVGLRDYARLGNAEYFCSVGMTVFSAQETWAGDHNFKSTTLEKLLNTRQYGKIYISLGLNDCGYDHDYFQRKYQELIDLIRACQPDAVIILQAVMTVSQSKANSAWYFGLDNLNAINQRIQSMSDGEQIRYVDVNEWIADENGYLPADKTGDGCHLYGKGYADWAGWIQENAGTLGID